MVVLIFKKGSRRVCSNHQVIILLTFCPGKLIPGCWKGYSEQLSNLRSRKSNADSDVGVEQWNNILSLARLMEWSHKFANPVYICFVGLEKAYDSFPQGVFWEAGVWGCYYKPYSHPDTV